MRSRTWRRGYGRIMDLDVIDLPDAVQLLRSRVPDLGQDADGQIAEELGQLLLALEQTAAYLDRTRNTPSGIPEAAARPRSRPVRAGPGH
jgi:hypothetical protein